MNPDDPAYPHAVEQIGPDSSGRFPVAGLTKREAFTKAAMQGLCYTASMVMDDTNMDIGKQSVALADATLRALGARDPQKLVEALRRLHDETSDYIRINNLGDTHHNESMKQASATLSEWEGGGR